jgi:hypothetical protein
MVVSSVPDLKANAAALLKALVSFSSITKSSSGPDQYFDRVTNTLLVKSKFTLIEPKEISIYLKIYCRYPLILS